MDVLIDRSAGLDVDKKKTVVACIRSIEPGGEVRKPTLVKCQRAWLV